VRFEDAAKDPIDDCKTNNRKSLAYRHTRAAGPGACGSLPPGANILVCGVSR
jgi:hypothetical protein